MAKVKEREKQPENLGEGREMVPPESPKQTMPPVDEKKDEAKIEGVGNSEEKKDEKRIDKEADRKEVEKGEAEKKVEDAKKVEEKAEPSADVTGENSIAPYAPENMQAQENNEINEESNFDKDNIINLNTHKKEKKSKTPIRDFIAEMCDMNGYKKDDKDKKTMSRKRAFANLVWYGAKLTVACTVFGPIVGSWLVAQYTNHDKASALESKMQNKVKFFTL